MYCPTYAFNETIKSYYWNTECITIKIQIDSKPNLLNTNYNFDNIPLENPRIHSIFFGNTNNGKWNCTNVYDVGDVSLEWETINERVIVYCAYKSHICYPKKGMLA